MSYSQIYAQDSSKVDEKFLLGPYSWEKWQSSCTWTDVSASDYSPKENVSDTLKNKIKTKNIEFVIFSGSWCGDSKEEVPKIFKLFKFILVDDKNYNLFGVDRQKQEPSGTFARYQIEKVPTLIVLVDGKEAGRIVEHPEKSWEEDILEILQ